MMTGIRTFGNPITGERMRFIQTGRDSKGMCLEIEFFIQPHSGKGIAAHYHPYFDEIFEFIGGSGCYIVGKDERVAHAGDTVVLPQGIPHIHPWNTGEDVLHVRKITQLYKPHLDWLLHVETFFESLYALAQQGRLGKDGLPSGLLQKVVLGQSLQPATYTAGVPEFVQRFGFGALAAFGRALGYSVYIPAQYIPESAVQNN